MATRGCVIVVYEGTIRWAARGQLHIASALVTLKKRSVAKRLVSGSYMTNFIESARFSGRKFSSKYAAIDIVSTRGTLFFPAANFPSNLLTARGRGSDTLDSGKDSGRLNIYERIFQAIATTTT